MLSSCCMVSNEVEVEKKVYYFKYYENFRY
jgi:hypothetical protein